MLVVFIFAAITMFIITGGVVVLLASKPAVDARLNEISRLSPGVVADEEEPHTFTDTLVSFIRPFRDIFASRDDELASRLSLAGFRESKHVDMYVASKLLLPVLGLLLSSFAGSNMFTVAVVGIAVGFFAPDIFVTQMVKRRRDSIRYTLPDALDLLVICMEAGLGIDQALIRVAAELKLTCPALAEEFQMINREQRAGKPRLEAWRSMSERVDIDFVRQFVAMLVQTERFGTPIAHALGQFADGLRLKRTQAAEEIAAKAGVKLLFPLVLFIFPSIFVVLLGPALLNIMKSLSDFGK